MGIKFLSIIFTFVFFVGTAQASFWDILSTPYNYFSDLYSGDDTEVVTGESVVSENDASQDQLDDNSDQSIYDINLDLNSSSTLPISFDSDPFGLDSNLSYAPSIYSPTWSTPNLSYGVGSTNYGIDYNNYSTCSAFDFSLCVFCFNLGLSELDEVYENQCKELYTEVPDERTDEEIDGYCACNENKNSEMFTDGSVKDFIAKAVEKKKIETAGEVISSFKKVARSVGLPKAHPFFKEKYEGEDARPEALCSADNFGKIIKELTTADVNGSSACKQDSIDELFEMAARQSDICNETRDGKLNQKNREHCKIYGGFDNLTEPLTGAENFSDRVAAFQDIFASGLQDHLDMVKASLFERDNIGILLRGFDSREKRPTLGNYSSIRTLDRSNEEEGVYNNALGPETVEEKHDRDLTHAMIENPQAFIETFHPENYAMAMKGLLQTPDACIVGDCFEHVRILATEPYVIGSMMRKAKKETALSPDMIRLIRKVKKNGGNSSLHNLGPDERRIIENHSQKILQTFKASAIDMLRQQHDLDLPRNLATLSEKLEQNKSALVAAESTADVEKEREIQEEIKRQEKVQREHLTMQGLFQKLVNNPQTASLEEIKGAFVAIWEAQSSQLNQACNAVKTQAEAYCRLKEAEDSNMYSAVDLLGLDFNKNKDIANELENKNGSKKVENPEYLAILDAMTCIEEGRYTKYPKNLNNPVFVTLSGAIEQCDQQMNNFDSFPKFLSTQEGAGKYTAMLAPNKTWEEWTRCGGTKMMNMALDASSLPLDPERGAELANVYKQTLGDVADTYKSSSTYDGGNSRVSNQLKKFKDQYGNFGASSFDSGFVSNGGGSSSNPQNNTSLYGPNSQNDVPESEVSGSSRGLASSRRYSNGATTIQNNGTVQYQPFVGENGETFQSQNLIDIENRIKQNNDDLVKARESSSVVEKKIVADGTGNASSEVLDQLAALRKQIEELRKSNEKLALERKLEIEKLKQEDLEASIADANKKNSPTQKSVVEPRETVASSSSRKSVVSVNSGNGSNGVVGGGNISNSGMSNNAGGSQADSSNTIPSETRVRSGQKRSGGRSGSVFLTGRTSSGEEFNISTTDVLNFEGRSDITSFDSAVSIALQSDKNAFIFEGKVYVKKGDNFIEVKDIEEQERALASDQEVGSIDDVKNLVQRLEQKEQEAGDEEEKSVDNISVKEVREEAAPRPERDRKEVEGLWNIIKENIFNFGS